MPANADDPRIARSRALITAAATDHFLRDGYQGANVDEIAAQAGVSKRTVYNIFGGKEQLFREILAGALDTAEAFTADTASALDGADHVETALRAVAVRLARIVLNERLLSLRRLLIAESQRFPELAGEYYQRAPGKVVATLAAAFARCRDRGQLALDDPELAAEQFAFLVLGPSLDRALFTGAVLHDPEVRAHEAVNTFLRAFAPAAVH